MAITLITICVVYIALVWLCLQFFVGTDGDDDPQM
jgi:hypothetical protein